MEESGLLGKIKNNYIFQDIFDYIKDDIIKLKLFKYSKLFKKKLNLDLFLYQKKYYELLGLNLFKYLSVYDEEEEEYPEKFDKDYLNKKFKKDLLHIGLNIKDFEKYIIKYFITYDYNIKNKKHNIKYIDIFSLLYLTYYQRLIYLIKYLQY